MKRSMHFRLPEFIFAALVLFSGVMLGFSSGGFIIDFQRLGFTVLSSMQKGVHVVVSGVTGTVTAVRDMANLKKEYKILTEKLQDYEYMQRNNTEIRKENERLKEQLDFARSAANKNISAQIIGRDPDSLYSGITIDKGIRSGIRKGMPVIAIQNGNVGVVGRIVTVGVGTSLIMPLYDINCSISARIQTTRDIGIVSGRGSQDSNLSLQYIRKRVADELSKGDIVVTSGENDNYMRDIPVGRIAKVTVVDYDSSLQIEVEPIIDFARLETVLVVDPGKENDRDSETEDRNG
ncbi:MAG: rod shape-determining protein MreC [Treponema sp.]|nr:rod shape-determining protein MreC [Treponema sp.]